MAEARVCWCRHIKGLHFTDVVALEVLLEVMACDSAAVAQPIQRLLLPSCFPDGPAGPPLVIALLCKSPEPALAFCHSLVGPWLAASRCRASGRPLGSALQHHMGALHSMCHAADLLA